MFKNQELWPKRFHLEPLESLASRCQQKTESTHSEGVILARERCILKISGHEDIECDARLVFRPEKYPSAIIELAGVDEFNFYELQSLGTQVEATFKESQFRFSKGQVVSSDNESGHPYNFRLSIPHPLRLERANSPGKYKEIEILLYNLPSFGFKGGPTNGREVLSLKMPNGWTAEIQRLFSEDLPENFDSRALSSPWYRATHVLRVNLTASSASSLEEVEKNLWLIRQFLSFAWGRWVGFGMVQVISEADELVFAQLGLTRTDPCILPDSNSRQHHWFSLARAESLQALLPGYWNLMSDAAWQDDLEWAIYWWLSANQDNQTAETAILASQAGLEVVIPHLLQSPQKNAAGRVKALLGVLHAGNGIPGNLDELRSFAADKNWDAAETFVKIRNALTHPSKDGEPKLAFEESQLGLRFLELALLYAMKYSGLYQNRTKFGKLQGQAEPVPWMK